MSREAHAVAVGQLAPFLTRFKPDAPVFVTASDGSPMRFEVGEAAITGGPSDGQVALMFHVVAGPEQDNIRAVEYYQARCMCCGEVLDEYGDYSAWSDPEGAIEQAINGCGWSMVDGQLLCTECWTSPDDDRESDDPIRAHATHPAAGV